MSTDSGSSSHWYCRPSITATSRGAVRSGVSPFGRLSPYSARSTAAIDSRTRAYRSVK